MQPTRNVRARKKATKLSISLSATLERAMDKSIRKREREQWLSENKQAMEAYNAHVEKHGVLSDGLRSF